MYDNTSWCRFVAYGQEYQGLGGFFGVDECNILAPIRAGGLATRRTLGKSHCPDMLRHECRVR